MKKILTVLLALSVVFTYTVSTAFAATAPNPPSKDIAESQAAFSEFLDETASKFSYDGNGYVTNVKDLVSGYNYCDGVLSKDAISATVENYRAEIYAKIADKTENWDSVWTGLEEKDVFERIVGSNAKSYSVWKAQAKIETEKANDILATDLSKYAAEDAEKIQAVIDQQTEALEKIVASIENKLGTSDVTVGDLTTIKAVTKAVKDELDKYSTTDDQNKTIAEAKAAATKALSDAAASFTEAVEDAYENPKDTTEAARKATLLDDVDKMVAFYEDAIAYGEIDKDNANMDTAKEVIAYLEWLVSPIKATFTAVAPFGEFYGDLDTLKMGDFVYTALETDAAKKKVERKEDGTLRYDPADVDKALADAKAVAYEAIKEDVFTKSAPTAIKLVPTTLTVKEGAYALKEYKADAIKKITEGDYALSKWSGERADKVEGIQNEYSDKILLANSSTEIDALVKEAKAAMDAILTQDQIDDLKDKTERRINALGYDSMLEKYYDAVVGSNGYSAKIKADAIEKAKDLLKDAVIAKENAKITYAEIDRIIKENKDAALAKVVDVKTVAELKTAADALKATFDTLPTSVTVADQAVILAAQVALDAYLDLPGTATSDISNYYKMQAAMRSLMTEEAKAVNAQIRALPSVITIDDAEAVEAARAAYDQLEEVYGAYDNDASFNYLGSAIQSLVTRYNALVKSELDLEAAKVADAAKKIEALDGKSTIEEVKAAQAAYDALKLESKLNFNDELYAKLVKAYNDAAITSVESLKLVKNHSTAGKTNGKSWIRIEWSTIGDDAAVDGYEIYKSTKKNSGYKHSFTTKNPANKWYKNTAGLKKGTRYYYKVRAFVEIDGQKYYSDWSNKAYRIAK